MPFANSYIDKGCASELDAASKFKKLAAFVVRNPLSTFFFRSKSKDGKLRFLIVDRAKMPAVGARVLLSTSSGLREARFKEDTPPRQVWGTVVWFLEQG